MRKRRQHVPAPLKEKDRVRGANCQMKFATPHPAFGHLLPREKDMFKALLILQSEKV
jgi:hypothetical protein